MNAVDYAIIVLMLLSIGVGVIRGAIREVMNLIGWVLAFVLAYTYAGSLALQFSEWVGEPLARTVLAWATIFLSVMVLAALVASLLSEVVRKLGLSALDRGVGALIGFARGVLMLLAITLIVGLTRVPQSAPWREAALTPWLEIVALYAKGVLPDSIAAKIRYRVPASSQKS
ncbi:MAG: CvpA family protein [Burkholderiales bacterium]|jgi:membrane protein required for colicin V production|nr:CvpA family protein [Nitrosomonadaceae bacterium]